MKKSVKLITGILGFLILVPGLAKFTEPFKTFIYKHLDYIGFPFPDTMQHVVKVSEVGVGLMMLFLAFKGNSCSNPLRNKMFYLGNFAIIIMMIVGVYTHLHPNVPAAILPFEYKPPIMPISYIVLALVNIYLYRKTNLQNEKR